MSLRPGRSGEAGGRGPQGRAGEERRAIAWAGESAELPSQYSPSKDPSRPLGSWGHKREVREIRRGRRKHPGEVGEEWKATAPPIQARGGC